MDSSTAAECAEIRKKLGGVKFTASRTGSDTFERFTGPQIRKFYKTEPKAYAKTTGIALVSSFMASLLAGKIAPIDFGDGAGMNLMDIRRKHWNPDALKATAPGLSKKLPLLAESGRVIGPVSSYFVKKYGLNPEALATVWTGDNPASVIGLGLIKPGQVAISLGTSDTFFGTMEKCQTDENGEGHVFGSPTGGYMTIICFKNGSLAREKIRELYKIPDWKKFGELVAQTKPGNDGGILLPWFEAEIVPRVNRPGIQRFDLDENNAAANCRAIFEAQALSMRLHSQWMQVAPEKILATGGASNDRALLQVLADVMNCRVLRIEVSKSAALGAALQAAHGWLVAADKNPKWEKIVAGFTARFPAAKSARTKRPRKFTASCWKNTPRAKTTHWIPSDLPADLYSRHARPRRRGLRRDRGRRRRQAVRARGEFDFAHVFRGLHDDLREAVEHAARPGGGGRLADDFHVHAHDQSAGAGGIADADGDDVVACVQIFFDVEDGRVLPVMGFAGALAVHKHRAAVVNAAKMNLDAGLSRVASVNFRCWRKIAVWPSVNCAFSPSELVWSQAESSKSAAYSGPPRARRDGGELPAPVVRRNGFRRRLGDKCVRLVAARIAVADADDFSRAVKFEIDFVPRHRHHAALRVRHGNGEHARRPRHRP